MLTTGSLRPCKVNGFGYDPLGRFQTAPVSQTGVLLAISKQKNHEQVSLRSSQTLTLLPSSLVSNGGLGIQVNNRNRKMNNMIVCCVDPGSTPPFPFNLLPGGNWQLWVVGFFTTIILPFTTSKWGPLLKLKNEAEKVLQTAEDIVEKVEEVAEKVEKMADEIGDQLPEGGKLRAAFDMVEDLAEETAKNARRADDLIDKVQEMEDKVEDFMEKIDDDKRKEEEPKEAKQI